MSESLLATKLLIPRCAPKVIFRRHLVERLHEGLRANIKLTLISAPAGFGKTTLVSHWISECQCAVAWLSIDVGDNDIGRFLAYLIAALQTIEPSFGNGLPELLQSSQPPSVEAILTALVNDLSAFPRAFILVLDDYHLIDIRPIYDAIAFLLDHTPPQMHLVIASREDPLLPLARLRASGQLTELRAADLRFSRSESAEFFDHVIGLNLSVEDVRLLDERTEGWIAGLKLAGLSLSGRKDVSQFILDFAGDHRYILDYLVEEVLQQQPAPIRNFLLQTSILSRMTGSLCDAVTGQENGQAQLEALERGNFFIVSLSDRRQWYRYHHLFAEVLSLHLATGQPDHVAVLHQRASAWYAQNGLMIDAVHHALAAPNFADAANLIEQAMLAMRQNRHDGILLEWLRALPDEQIWQRPILAVAYAHVLLANGQLEGVAERLDAAEHRLEAVAAVGRRADSNVDTEMSRRLLGEIAVARAGLALVHGDMSNTVTYAQRALATVPADDHLTRGGAAGFLGLAFWTNGDLLTAHQTYGEGMISLQKAGNISDAVNGAIALATICITRGRLREAMRTYERGLQLAAAQGGLLLRGAADMHVGISELLRERNQLDAAAERLQHSREMGEHAGFPHNRYRWYLAMARVREALGDFDGALALLEEAQRLYMVDFYPPIRPISAVKTRILLAQQRMGEALDWVIEQHLTADDELHYLREFEHITLARILLARFKNERSPHIYADAMRLLARLLEAAEKGDRTGSVIEILILQALGYQMQEDIVAALAPLERALRLAEPEGYVRLFLDEGSPMAQLLEAAIKRGMTPDYGRHLLVAFGHTETTPYGKPQLIERLTERELEVLRLLATDLSGPEIARRQTVSLSTIRTHTKNIYSKLAVNSRRAAVRRAFELDLL